MNKLVGVELPLAVYQLSSYHHILKHQVSNLGMFKFTLL